MEERFALFHYTFKNSEAGLSCHDKRHLIAGHIGGHAAVPLFDGFQLRFHLAEFNQIVGHHFALQTQRFGFGFRLQNFLLGFFFYFLHQVGGALGFLLGDLFFFHRF